MPVIQARGQEAGVVAVRDEADVEALRLLRRDQAQLPGAPPDLRLAQLADG